LQFFSITFLPQRRGATFKSQPNSIADASLIAAINKPEFEKQKQCCQKAWVNKKGAAHKALH
jgi:hypothetical protein